MGLGAKQSGRSLKDAAVTPNIWGQMPSKKKYIFTLDVTIKSQHDTLSQSVLGSLEGKRTVPQNRFFKVVATGSLQSSCFKCWMKEIHHWIYAQS